MTRLQAGLINGSVLFIAAVMLAAGLLGQLNASDRVEQTIESLKRQAVASTISSDPCADEAQLVDFWDAVIMAAEIELNEAETEEEMDYWQAVIDSATEELAAAQQALEECRENQEPEA